MSRAWEPTTEFDFTCLHESGHSVVANAGGCTVKSVTAKEQSQDVRVGFTDYDPPAHLDFREQRFTDIGVLYGGKAAESIIGRRERSKGFSADQIEIREKLRELSAISPASFSEHDIVTHCEKLAREIVQANTQTTRRLAKLLAERGEVRGTELNSSLQHR
jgi:ATP-dependent Zn protease